MNCAADFLCRGEEFIDVGFAVTDGNHHLLVREHSAARFAGDQRAACKLSFWSMGGRLWASSLVLALADAPTPLLVAQSQGTPCGLRVDCVGKEAMRPRLSSSTPKSGDLATVEVKGDWYLGAARTTTSLDALRSGRSGFVAARYRSCGYASTCVILKR